MASQITGFSIVYSTVCSSADQRKYSKLCVTGLCEGDSPVSGEFPAQRASKAENVFIWWRHHVIRHKVCSLLCGAFFVVIISSFLANRVFLFSIFQDHFTCTLAVNYPVSKVHVANMGPSGADRTQVGPMLAPWILLSGYPRKIWAEMASSKPWPKITKRELCAWLLWCIIQYGTLRKRWK